MANWKEYTTKTTIEDADEIMIADTKANANKRTPLGGLWNWIAGKLATAVISQLETQNKSIIPALNELNSKAQIVCVTGTTNDVGIVTVYGKFAVSKAYCLSNVASQLTTPYRITVDSISSTNLRLRIRDIATNKALANADLPKFDVLIVGK